MQARCDRWRNRDVEGPALGAPMRGCRGPLAPQGYLFLDRDRSMSELLAEFFRRLFLALANPAAVNDDVTLIGNAINFGSTEVKFAEVHGGAPFHVNSVRSHRVIPHLASSSAIDRVSPIIPDLATPYGARSIGLMNPAIEASEAIRPHLRLAISHALALALLLMAASSAYTQPDLPTRRGTPPLKSQQLSEYRLTVTG